MTEPVGEDNSVETTVVQDEGDEDDAKAFSQPVGEPAADKSWQDRLKEYLPLLAATTLTVYISIRLLVVAQFDSETAYGILQATGTASVVVGTLIPAVGSFVVIGAMFCFVTLYLSRKDYKNTSLRSLLLITGISLSIIGALIAAFGLILISASLLLFMLIRKGQPVMAGRRRISFYHVVGLLTILTLAASLFAIPW